jgi:Caspase domain/Bacterial Ig domain
MSVISQLGYNGSMPDDEPPARFYVTGRACRRLGDCSGSISPPQGVAVLRYAPAARSYTGLTSFAGAGTDIVMRSLILAFCLVLALASAAEAAKKRIAVVVGTGSYSAAPVLANPPRDARAIAAALQRLGFDTTLVIDPDRAALEKAIRALGDHSQDADAAIFFFAGHALEASGHNVLIPISAHINNVRDLPFETVDLDLVMSQLDGRARTVLIFLDACRDNPFLRTLSGSGRGIAVRGGLAAPASDVTGTLIAFATAPGRVASDGQGMNSPFTTALLHHIDTEGLEVRQMLSAVRKEVREATHGEQVPWESSALEAEFYFRPTRGSSTANSVASTEKGSRCQVPHLSGHMRQGGANGTMEVISDGRGCGFSVWYRLSTHEIFEALEVTTPPKNGTVKIEDGHRIVYTPRTGYAGPDQFTVTSTPRGTVTMQVTAIPSSSVARRE